MYNSQWDRTLGKMPELDIKQHGDGVLLTVKVRIFILKVAVTDLAVVMDTTQEPVPEQAPLQPTKSEVAAGEAVRVTVVPWV